MKKTFFLIAISIGLISSCDKAEEQYQQTNLKREYKLGGNKLTLTYNINKDGRVAVVEKTNDNLAIHKFFKENPNTFVNYNLETGEGEIYKSVEEFQATCKPLSPDQVKEVNQLKSAKLGINFYAYHHPNYNSLAYSSGINHQSAYTGLNHTEFFLNYVNKGVPNADWKGFAVNTLPNASNSITSIQVIQNTSSAAHSRTFFQVMIYDKTNFNLNSQLYRNGYATGFYTNGTSPQNGCDDLRKWVMVTFFWFTTVTWNDDIESMSGYYRN
ncbi:MAG: hypothetical protein ACK5UE_11690 [Chitinophagales bacterium]|jgi:hypothetical protein